MTDTAPAGVVPVVNEHRRRHVRLEISRAAAQLFWEQGVAATSGEQIAAAVGLSVRTLWRHFRNKESCVEPVMAQDVQWFVEALRGWPRELSLEEHLTVGRDEMRRTPQELADDLAAARMVTLGEAEPALRSAWLMACDQAERELAEVIAGRLGAAAGDGEVRRHAAAVTGAVRAINEAFGPALLSGRGPARIPDPLPQLARAVRVATGGAVGDPVDP